MASRKLFTTSCDDDGNLAIELMKPTRKDLERAEMICANLAKSIPALAVQAADTAAALSDILNTRQAHVSDDPTDDGDDLYEYEPADALHSKTEVVC